MTAIWRESVSPSWLAGGVSFSFYDIAEIAQEAPSAYEAAMQDLRIREEMLGADWFRHNAELARGFAAMKKAWWMA